MCLHPDKYHTCHLDITVEAKAVPLQRRRWKTARTSSKLGMTASCLFFYPSRYLLFSRLLPQSSQLFPPWVWNFLLETVLATSALQQAFQIAAAGCTSPHTRETIS